MRNFFELPFNAKAMFVSSFVIMLLLCYLNCDIWSTRMDYTFGYLTPFFVAYVVFDRKENIFAYFNGEPIFEGSKLLSILCTLFFVFMLVCSILITLLFASAFFLTGQRGGPIFGTTFGAVWLCLSMAYFSSAYNCSGKKMSVVQRLNYTALFIFPCFIWLIATPLFGAGEELVSLALLSIVSETTFYVLDNFGFLVELRGNTISFPNGSVGVADACSGIRSLTACLFAGSFLAAVFLDKFWKKFSLVVCSMFLAFFNNILRALFLSIWAYNYGSDSISGFVHDAAGYVVLGLTVIGLFILIPIFMINPIPPEFRNQK